MEVKAKPIWHRAIIVFASLFIVCAILLSMSISHHAPSKEELRSLLENKSDILRKAAIDAGGRRVDRRQADTASLQVAFALVELTSIDARNEDGSVYFSFDWAYLGDTTIDLYYLPSDMYPEPETKEWRLTSSSENAWRWDGGGMMGKGYFIVERLQKNWFYIEEYYPT